MPIIPCFLFLKLSCKMYIFNHIYSKNVNKQACDHEIFAALKSQDAIGDYESLS
jgi:hypothetical protein